MRSRYFVDPAVFVDDAFAVFCEAGDGDGEVRLYADGLSLNQADTLAWRMNLGPL